MKNLYMILSLTLILCFTINCKDKQTMSEIEAMKAQAEVEEQNAAIVRSLLEEVINKGNIELADTLISDDFVDHNPLPGLPPTKEGFKQSFLIFREAFPDLEYTIEDIFAANDKVAVRWTASGTNAGELMGMPPTNQQVRVSGMDIFRVVDEQLVELWLSWDQMGMMMQLGMELTPKKD